MGDLKGTPRNKINNLRVGKYGEAIINNNGERFIDLYTQNNLRIMNEFFLHKNIHRYTWQQNTRQVRSVIDYTIVRQNTRRLETLLEE